MASYALVGEDYFIILPVSTDVILAVCVRMCMRMCVRVCAFVCARACARALIILGLTLSTSNWQSDTQTHGDATCVCVCVSGGTTVPPAGSLKTVHFVYVNLLWTKSRPKSYKCKKYVSYIIQYLEYYRQILCKLGTWRFTCVLFNDNPSFVDNHVVKMAKIYIGKCTDFVKDSVWWRSLLDSWADISSELILFVFQWSFGWAKLFRIHIYTSKLNNMIVIGGTVSFRVASA